jgi:transposase
VPPARNGRDWHHLLELPMAIEITGGMVSDHRGYAPLMAADGPPARVPLADRGHDSDAIRRDMDDRGGVAIIPALRSRKVRESVDDQIYALRNRIARCFNRLENARRVATRYDETAGSFLRFVQIASIRLWIRHFVDTVQAVLTKSFSHRRIGARAPGTLALNPPFASDSEVPVACDPAGHELDHGDLEEGLDGGGGALDVSGEAAVDAGPGEGALVDPAFGLHDEAGVIKRHPKLARRRH